MKLASFSGKVSHVNRTSHTYGGGSGGEVQTSHNTTLRLDGRHVELQGSATWLSEDDLVVIVAEESQGSIEPLAVRNETTGYESVQGHASYKIAIVLIVIGVFSAPVVIGWPIMALGAWFLSVGMKRNKLINEAASTLRKIPSPSGAQASSGEK
ncbi:hypothetical protein IEN85_15840 [Pelagicoccus sp. NFK12]|uniref:Uncharacterized protein n=1 Tax=Pelagicoccus enzymogenes TaxID=2773457 RepID=A0A927IGA0_9BACT|nr:hypothetical protein [Pelagicoccus enzymogenes]MBD5780972.1 hypothetical protein [Pelagicoccus enzymogenes]